MNLKNSDKNIYFKILTIQFFIFIGIFIILLFWNLANSINNIFIIYILSSAIFVNFLWSCFSWKKIFHSYFDPYILFLSAAYIFNAGHAFLELIGLNKYGILDSEFSQATTLKTLFLVLISLSFLHLGALMAGRHVSLPSPSTFTSQFFLWETRQVGLLLLFISAVPAFFLIKKALSITYLSGYFALYQRQLSTGFEATPRVLATFLIPGALFFMAGCKAKLNWARLSFFLIFLYSLAIAALGYRAHAFMPLIASAWLWHRTIKPLPRLLLFSVGVVLFIVVFPSIKLMRNVAGMERFSLSFLIDVFLGIENPFFFIVHEMGNTMAIIAYTLEMVPQIRPFDLGESYFYAFLTLFPNLFWPIHPSIAHETLSTWLVWKVNPQFAELGGGFGFSFIAEAYLNFGWFGSCLTMLAFGYILGKIFAWEKTSPTNAKSAAVASFLAFILFFPRGESVEIFRSIFWYALFPYFCIYYFGKIKRNILTKHI